GTPLRDVIEFLSDRYDLTILVDKMAFRAAGMEAVDELRIELPRMRGVQLGTVLRMLTDQLSGTYIVHDDHVEFTTLPRTWVENWSKPEMPRDPASLRRVNAEFENRPLDQALRELANQSGINIVLDGRVRDQSKNEVTATFTNLPVDTAVQLLAD